MKFLSGPMNAKAFKRPFCSAVLMLAASLGVLRAEVIDVLSFGGPEVLKLDWTTRSMKAADINGDRLNDFALINNDRARIEIFYQRGEGDEAIPDKKRLSRNRWEPVLEDARFYGESLSIGYPLFDLAVGDLNGDGRADLAYTSREVPLTIRYQGDAGSWIDVQEFDSFDSLGWVQTVAIRDLDNDGANEVVVVSFDAIRIFSKNEEGRLSEPEVYYLTGENPFNLMITDVTGDGLLDILYITAAGKQSLALREQSGEGAFGPEYRFTFDRPIRSLKVFEEDPKGGPLFCSVDSRSGSLEFFRISKSGTGAKKSSSSIHTEESELAIYPILKEDKATPSYLITDLDGKGSYDLLATNPAAAELIYFPSQDGEFLGSRVFPSFSGVSSITGGRFHKAKGDSVVLISETEKVLGLSRLDKSGRMSFPKQFELGEGDPLVASAIDLDDDGYDELVVCLEEDGDRKLVLAKPSAIKEPESDWEVLASLDLEGIRRSPDGILPVDIFDTDRQGFFIFVPREAPKLVTVGIEDGDYVLKEFASGSSILESLLKGVRPAQLSVFDFDGDGQNELVAGRSGYARALRVAGDELEMVDQFNALRNDDEVMAIIPISDKHGTVQQLVFYIASSGEFQYLSRDTDGVFRFDSSREVGSIDIQDWFFLPSDSGAEKIILTGMDSLWAIDPSQSTWQREIVSSYETELENINFNYVTGGLFDEGAGLGIVAIDGNNHVVELLSKDEETWQSSVYWEVFEQNMHYQGRTGSNTEPREVVVSDFTGDGKLDFAFLIHDRILFYPQQ